MRRFVAVLSIAIGLALVVFTFASSAFLRLGDGEHVMDTVRPYTKAAGFNGFKLQYAETMAAVNQLTGTVYPAFARDFGMTPAQFRGYVDRQYPSLAHGLAVTEALPSLITPVAEGVAALPDGKFEPVYNLPIRQLPLTSVPWILLALGGVLVLGGVGILLLPARWVVGGVAVVGLAMVVVPFAISLPSKIHQTSRVIALSDVGLSQTAATRSEQSSYGAAELVRELDRGLIPADAKRRGISVTAERSRLATEAPALTKFLNDFHVIGPAAVTFATALQSSVGPYHEAEKFPFGPLPWLIVALGAALAAAAAASFVPLGSRAPVPAAAPTSVRGG